jgi:hypothetical protein
MNNWWKIKTEIEPIFTQSFLAWLSRGTPRPRAVNVALVPPGCRCRQWHKHSSDVDGESSPWKDRWHLAPYDVRNSRIWVPIRANLGLSSRTYHILGLRHANSSFHVFFHLFFSFVIIFFSFRHVDFVKWLFCPWPLFSFSTSNSSLNSHRCRPPWPWPPRRWLSSSSSLLKLGSSTRRRRWGTRAAFVGLANLFPTH